MNRRTGATRSPLTFFGLVFALSVPFWLIGALTERFLPQDRPINLPVSALMLVNPMIAAFMLTFVEDGADGARRLAQRIFDDGRIQPKTWYLPVFLVMPLIAAVEYAVMSVAGRHAARLQFPIATVPVLFGVFFVGAIAEELGWTGYATDPLQGRWNAAGAGITVGIVWALWHVVPYAQAHNPPAWIAWQCGMTVASRVLIVWLYNNTGRSLFAAIVFHAMGNVRWSLYGASYDPFVACIVMAAVAAVVAFLWGPETLARYRYARVRGDAAKTDTRQASGEPAHDGTGAAE